MKEARTLVEKCKFIAGLEEGEEFEVVGDQCNPYRLENGDVRNCYGVCVIAFDVDAVLKKLPWKPKNGEICYLVSALEKTGIGKMIYLDSETYKRAYKRNMIFKTEEEALARVKELGW